MCFLITWAPKGTLAEKVGHLKAEASTEPATLAKKLLPMTYFHEFTTRVAFANLWDTHICENKIQITNSRWTLTPNESDTVLSVKPLSCRARVRAQTSCDFLLLPGKGPFLHRLEHKTKKNFLSKALKQSATIWGKVRSIHLWLTWESKFEKKIMFWRHCWQNPSVLLIYGGKNANHKTEGTTWENMTEAFWNHSGQFIFWKLLSSSATVFVQFFDW